ncbi:uncharacterized protein HD556DRAFT_1414001 [Suillus plorans]|uniref:Uncharacterized protein n=1 Tax=Suillus plorans TaxID=116603 RepID=A0A9P7ACT8_9AGAM|nr:uncharacterized protein HD556DRAFT_1414001 [Suillus plorans]KAG1786721.1 hypothetical protein HD556DRAFT_1414001 [Suillus plorans]
MDRNFKAEHLHPIKPFDEVWLVQWAWISSGVHGIGGVACARHGCFVPHSMVDFQKGKRQMNMDYALCEASRHNMEGITRAVTFYDINCQYNKHFRVRVDRSRFLEMAPQLTIIPGIGLWHIHGHQDSCYVRYASNFIEGMTLWARLNLISPAARGIKWKAFDRLDEAAPLHLKTEWLARERIAQSSRLNDPSAMDEYEINIKKAPSKKEIELRLLEEGNARNAAPSRDLIGRRSTETQRLDIARQIDGFARSALTHLGEGFDADDEPEDLNVDILDDLDDDPADFTETSHTWTNSPELTVIPLPSNLGVDRCRRCMAEDLIPLEMSLREGQANDALHNLRIYLCNKAILFRTTVRQAKSQALKTRAWSQVTSVQQAVSLHASIYTKTRKQMMKLEPGQDQLQKYKPLLREQLKISTAVGDPNARGQRNESLAWFWSVEVDLGGPDQSWNEECEFLLACHIPRLPDWTHAKFTESIGCGQRHYEIDGGKK